MIMRQHYFEPSAAGQMECMQQDLDLMWGHLDRIFKALQDIDDRQSSLSRYLGKRAEVGTTKRETADQIEDV